MKSKWIVRDNLDDMMKIYASILDNYEVKCGKCKQILKSKYLHPAQNLATHKRFMIFVICEYCDYAVESAKIDKQMMTIKKEGVKK